MNRRLQEQPPPEDAFYGEIIGNALADTLCAQGAPNWLLQDVADRTEQGRRRYGTALKTFNGRDMVCDAHQEGLDALFYLQGAALEGNTAVAEPFALILRAVILLGEMRPDLSGDARQGTGKGHHGSEPTHDTARASEGP